MFKFLVFGTFKLLSKKEFIDWIINTMLLPICILLVKNKKNV